MALLIGRRAFTVFMIVVTDEFKFKWEDVKGFMFTTLIHHQQEGFAIVQLPREDLKPQKSGMWATIYEIASPKVRKELSFLFAIKANLV